MKRNSLAGPVKGMLTSGATVAFLFGLGYLLDCRFNTRGGWESQDRCWLTAGSMMGVGGGTGLGFALGYNTYNPTLREPDGRGRRTEPTDQPEA
jgi:hypothetical protein